MVRLLSRHAPKAWARGPAPHASGTAQANQIQMTSLPCVPLKRLLTEGRAPNDKFLIPLFFPSAILGTFPCAAPEALESSYPPRRPSLRWPFSLEAIRQVKQDGRFSLTLEAQVFPMVSVKGTVELGAGQLLVDGLEHSAMCWVLAVQATCSKTCTLSTRLFPGRNQRFPEDGKLNDVKTCYSVQEEHPSCSHGNWNGQEPEHVPWGCP